MTNGIWYFLLVFISVIIFFLTFRYGKDFRKDLAVYFFAAGLSFFVEFVILVILNAYSYYPHVFAEKWTDDIFGSLISQAVIIPTILMTIAAFQLRTRWVILIIAAISLIEELFLSLGIYEHNWWKTIYTIILLYIASHLVKWWRKRLDNPSAFIQLINIYMLGTTILHTISFFVTTVYKSKWYTIGWFSSAYKDHILFNILMGVLYTIPITVIVIFFYHYLSLIGIFLLVIIFEFTLYKLELLQVYHSGIIIASGIIVLSITMIVKRLNEFLFPRKVKEQA